MNFLLPGLYLLTQVLDLVVQNEAMLLQLFCLVFELIYVLLPLHNTVLPLLDLFLCLHELVLLLNNRLIECLDVVITGCDTRLEGKNLLTN